MTRIITADEARKMSNPIELTLDTVMESIKRSCENGRRDCVYSLVTHFLSDETLSTLKKVGYDIKISKYSDGASFITISWLEKPAEATITVL